MKSKHQLEITINCKQHGYKKNKKQLVRWLQTAMPLIITKQKLVTEDWHLKTLSHSVSLCLS
jgi:hypothetical protein